jgi:hypothetical protein
MMYVIPADYVLNLTGGKQASGMSGIMTGNSYTCLSQAPD